jgi:hypothetical protein
VHLDWSVLPDLHGSAHYPVNLHISTPSPTVSRRPNWITRRADWAGFSQSLIFEDQEFPSVNTMVEYFTSTVFRAASQYIPQSSTTPHRTRVPWWTDECRDAIRARKRAFSSSPYKTDFDIIYKLPCQGPTCHTRSQAHIMEGLCLLVSPGPHVRMSYGTTTVYVR